MQPNDHVTVTEYMNAEWWKGKSSRTGREGIFPRSYVKVIEKAPQNMGNNYGNAPLEVSQMGNGEGRVPSKGEEMGKKFGKKLGNAASKLGCVLCQWMGVLTFYYSFRSWCYDWRQHCQLHFTL